MNAVRDSDRVAAAEAYIDALVSHDGDSVPFAADCTRIEQGLKNGFSGNHLRRGLNRGLQYRIISAATDRQFSIDSDVVRATFTIVTKAALFGRRVDETFLIPATDGKIHHIRVRIHPRIRREG